LSSKDYSILQERYNDFRKMRGYTDDKVGILSGKRGEKHNSITPIAEKMESILK
jgi:galactose-1-phosphate uridylyltransferase